jgi:hypothetical protein
LDDALLVLPPEELGCEGCGAGVDEPVEPAAGAVDPVVVPVAACWAGSVCGSAAVGVMRPTAIRVGLAAGRSTPAGGACGLGGRHVGEASQTIAAA